MSKPGKGAGKQRGRGSAPGHRRGNPPAGGREAREPMDLDDGIDPTTGFEPRMDDFDLTPAVRQAYDAWVAGRDPDLGPCELGRVCRLDRGYPLVITASGSKRAEHAISLVKDKDTDVRCAVGDWVVLGVPQGHDKTVVEYILPRSGSCARWDGGNFGDRQVLVSNIDLVVAVAPLGKREVEVERLARAAVLAAQGGAALAVALTKADRAPGPEHIASEVSRVSRALGTGVAVVVISSVTGQGIDELRALMPPGSLSMLLGKSGAGKSTLINALMGCELLDTREVRDRDDRGRHTTVARRMLKLPGAGVLVDAPGLRNMTLLDEEAGLASAFGEVSSRAPQCRFRDCTHGPEPGCAVVQGVHDGLVDPERVRIYRLLRDEMNASRRGLDLAADSSITR